MSAPKILSNGKVLAVLAGVGAVVALVYYLKKGAAAVVDVAKVRLDPVNPNNVVNATVTHFGAGISGNQNWTLGGSLYDLFHPNQPNLTAPVKVAPRKVLAAAKPSPKKAGVA